MRKNGIYDVTGFDTRVHLWFAMIEFVLQVQEQRMFYHHIKCVVTDVKVCRVCKKKIGNRSESNLVHVHRSKIKFLVIRLLSIIY